MAKRCVGSSQKSNGSSSPVVPRLGQEQEGNLNIHLLQELFPTLCFPHRILYGGGSRKHCVLRRGFGAISPTTVLYLDFWGTTKKLGCNMHVPHVWHSRSDLYLGGGQDGHCFRVAKFSMEDVNNLTW